MFVLSTAFDDHHCDFYQLLFEFLEFEVISQNFDADYINIRMLAEHMIDKVAADKTGASRNENLHVFVLHIK